MIPDADKDQLNKSRPKLAGSMDLQSGILLDELISRDVITSHQKEVIKCEKGNYNQATALLDALLMGGVDTLDKFIYSLRASSPNHAELATTCLRPPNKPDIWTEDTAAGASAQPSAGPSATAGSRPIAQASIPMTEAHKNTINRNFEVLAEDLLVDRIFNRLVTESIITNNDVVDIRQESPTQRAGALLRLILKREDRAFYVLKKACEDKGMQQLAELLTD